MYLVFLCLAILLRKGGGHMVAKLVAYLVICMQSYKGIIMLVCVMALITFFFYTVGCYTAWHVGCVTYLLSKYCLIFICILGAINMTRLVTNDMHKQNMQVQAEVRNEFCTTIGDEEILADMKTYSAEMRLDTKRIQTTFQDVINSK